MEIRFNVTGKERKALVEAVSAVTGWAAVYKYAPSFAFVVNQYTIDKTGTLCFDGEAVSGDAVRLLAKLAERGYVSEDSFDLAASDEGVSDAGNSCAGQLTEHTPAAAPDRLSIKVPLDGFTGTALANLEKLVASKAGLIQKSIGADALPVMRENDRLCFPWFTLDASPGELGAYTQFVHALCEMAKNQKRVTATEKPAESEKFAFRCFLLRLGFIGGEYASARKILLANLPGNGSFKSGQGRERNEAAPVGANVADNGLSAVGCPAPAEEETAAQIAERDSLAEALADAELIHGVNMLFETEMSGDGSGVETLLRCGECQHHAYYTDGLLRSNDGNIVDTSKRTPCQYTHYCTATSRGFRKIKHASDWTGSETSPKWCPLLSAQTNEIVTGNADLANPSWGESV